METNSNIFDNDFRLSRDQSRNFKKSTLDNQESRDMNSRTRSRSKSGMKSNYLDSNLNAEDEVTITQDNGNNSDFYILKRNNNVVDTLDTNGGGSFFNNKQIVNSPFKCNVSGQQNNNNLASNNTLSNDPLSNNPLNHFGLNVRNSRNTSALINENVNFEDSAKTKQNYFCTMRDENSNGSSMKKMYYRQLYDLFKDNDDLQKQVSELSFSLREETIHCEEQRMCISVLKKIINEKQGGLAIRQSNGENVIFEETSTQNYKSSGTMILNNAKLEEKSLLKTTSPEKNYCNDKFESDTKENYKAFINHQLSNENISILEQNDNSEQYKLPIKVPEKNKVNAYEHQLNPNTYQKFNRTQSLSESKNTQSYEEEDSTLFKEFKVNFKSKQEPIVNFEKTNSNIDTNPATYNKLLDSQIKKKNNSLPSKRYSSKVDKPEFGKNYYGKRAASHNLQAADNISSDKENTEDANSTKTNRLLSTNKNISLTPQKQASKVAFQSNITQMSKTDILRLKVNELLPDNLMKNNYESRTACLDSLEKLLLDVKDENDGLRRIIREKNQEIVYEKSRNEIFSEKFQKKFEKLEISFTDQKKNILEKNKTIADLRTKIDYSEIKNTKCNQCENAYSDLNELKKQVELINLESQKKRNNYNNSLCKILKQTCLQTSKLVVGLSFEINEEFIDEAQDTKNKIADNLNSLLDKNFDLEPSDQQIELGRVLLEITNYAYIINKCVSDLLENKVSNREHETNKQKLSEEEKHDIIYKKLLDQKNALSSTNNLLHIKIQNHEKKLKSSEEIIEKLTLNFEDAMKQFENKISNNKQQSKTENNAFETIFEKTKVLVNILKKILNDNRQINLIDEYLSIQESYKNVMLHSDYKIKWPNIEESNRKHSKNGNKLTEKSISGKERIKQTELYKAELKDIENQQKYYRKTIR